MFDLVLLLCALVAIGIVVYLGCVIALLRYLREANAYDDERTMLMTPTEPEAPGTAEEQGSEEAAPPEEEEAPDPEESTA